MSIFLVIANFLPIKADANQSRLIISNFLGEADADKTGGDAPDQTGRNAETNSGGKREIVEARRNDPQPTARQAKTGGTKASCANSLHDFQLYRSCEFIHQLNFLKILGPFRKGSA